MNLSEIELVGWTQEEFKIMAISVRTTRVVLLDMDWKEFNK